MSMEGERANERESERWGWKGKKRKGKSSDEVRKRGAERGVLVRWGEIKVDER